MDVKSIMDRVRAYRLQEGLTKVAYAELAGLAGDTTIRSIDDPEWNPTLKTLSALAAVIPPDWAPEAPTIAAE